MPKNQQNPHEWVRTILTIVGVGAIIFFLLWLMCMWEDDDCPTHSFLLDLDLPGPGFWCCPGQDEGGGYYESPPEDEEDVCPPINIKMKAALPMRMATAESVCRTNGGLWLDSSVQLACQDSLGRLDCRDLEYNPATSANYALTRNTCHDQGGQWLCAPTYIGCHCGGSGTPPPYDCAYVWSTIGGGRCNGGCDEPTDTCKEIEGECVCFNEDWGDTNCGWKSEIHSPDMCYGDCPLGEYCTYFSGDLLGDPVCECSYPT